MLLAALHGLGHLSDVGEDFDFTLVLSETHYPLRSRKQLERALDLYRGMSFVGINGCAAVKQ